VEYVPKGIDDNTVISLAKEKKAVLLTRDFDSANMILYPPKDYFGIVAFEIHPPKPDKLIDALAQLLENVSYFKGRLLVALEDEFIVFEGSNSFITSNRSLIDARTLG